MTALPLSIDLLTSRVVYPNDLRVGMRTLGLAKGTTYGAVVSFVSGVSGLNVPISGFSYSASQPGRRDTPLFSASGIASGAFQITAASPVLDYAIGARDSLTIESYISFESNGTPYNIAALPTTIANTPDLSPQQEYYPAGNPSGFLNASSSLNSSSLTGVIATANLPTGVLHSTSSRVIYASQIGCALNSSLATGGGTDDSLALQAGLDYLNGIGGGKLVVEGPALVSNAAVNHSGGNRKFSALTIYSNVTLEFLNGAGLFMKAGSNCTFLSNNAIATNGVAPHTNISVIGGTFNCNGSNQSKFEYGLNPGNWSFGLWFQNVNGLTLKGVTLLNAPSFAFVFNKFQNVWCENLAAIGAGVYGNGDGLHLYDGTNFHCDGWVHQGNDDSIAINADEAIYITSDSRNGGGTPLWGRGLIVGLDRFTYNGGSTTGGDCTRVVIRNAYIYGTGHAVAYNIYYAGTGTELVLENIRGSGTAGFHYGNGWGTSNPTGLHDLKLLGYHGLNGYADTSSFTSGNWYNQVRFDDIDPGLDITNVGAITGTYEGGDYFPINAGEIGGVLVTGTPTAGQVLTATDYQDATWATPTSGGGASEPSLLDGILAYWDMGDSSFTDATGNGFNLSADSGATVTNTSALVGVGASFNGSGDLKNGTVAESLSGSFTIAGWFNFSSSDCLVATLHNSDSGTDFLTMVVDELGNASVTLTDPDNDTVTLTAPTTVEPGTWYFAAFTWDADSGTPTFYINNVPDEGFDGSFTGMGSGDSFKLGNYYSGLCDEWGIWTRVLTGDEMAAMFNGNDGITYSDF